MKTPNQVKGKSDKVRNRPLYGLCLIFLIVCILSSCATGPPTEDDLIREKIPIEIQGSNPVRFVIHARSPGGVAMVGIRCSPEVWNSLTGGTNDIEIELVSSRWNDVKIRREALVRHGSRDTDISYYDLFSLLGNYQAFTKVAVQITFPKAPPGVTHAGILVFRMPTDSL